jgi:hypothetical protein
VRPVGTGVDVRHCTRPRPRGNGVFEPDRA